MVAIIWLLMTSSIWFHPNKIHNCHGNGMMVLFNQNAYFMISLHVLYYISCKSMSSKQFSIGLSLVRGILCMQWQPSIYCIAFRTWVMVDKATPIGIPVSDPHPYHNIMHRSHHYCLFYCVGTSDAFFALSVGYWLNFSASW